MCRKKRIKKKIAFAIVDLHMMLLGKGIFIYIPNNWLLSLVPKLMDWKPVTLMVERTTTEETDVQA